MSRLVAVQRGEVQCLPLTSWRLTSKCDAVEELLDEGHDHENTEVHEGRHVITDALHRATNGSQCSGSQPSTAKGM